MATAANAEHPLRNLCTALHDSGCRISEALALTPERIDLNPSFMRRPTLGLPPLL